MPDLVSLFAKIKPAVVAIVRRSGDGPLDQEVVGTGFNVDPRGVIVTCRHVVQEYLRRDSYEQLQAQFVVPRDGALARGDVPVTWAVAHDIDDVAIIRLVRGSEPLPFMTLGNGSRVAEGTPVAICGYPLGLALEPNARSAASTFQVGIVGSITPHPTAPPLKRLTYRLDIAINQGNSGGPVFLQEDGAVVGIVEARPRVVAPVYEKRVGQTDLTAAVTSALTHATPIDRSLHLIERARRLTAEEMEGIRGGNVPAWWRDLKLPL